MSEQAKVVLLILLLFLSKWPDFGFCNLRFTLEFCTFSFLSSHAEHVQFILSFFKLDKTETGVHRGFVDIFNPARPILFSCGEFELEFLKRISSRLLFGFGMRVELILSCCSVNEFREVGLESTLKLWSNWLLMSITPESGLSTV